MNTRTITTIAAVGVIAIAGTIGGYTIGRSTAPPPEACLTAIEDADQIIGLTGDALDLSADGIVSAATWDAAGLGRMTEDIEAITAQLEDIDYVGSKTACQDGA